jgi:ribonucleotide monophosphatase NagD (HAD superfamily)
LTGVLVRTGKFGTEQLQETLEVPDHVIDSVADLPPLLESLRK